MKFVPPLIAMLGSSDPPGVLPSVFWLVFWLSGIVASTYAIHFLYSLPMRRAERARLFLDLVEDAIARGQSIEEMVVSLAQNRDRTVGTRFHLLAAYIESGLGFGDALKKVPRFLPPQISAMLFAGLELGEVRRVVPACREILRDHPVGVRSAVHYLILVVFIFSPAFITVLMLTAVFVIPRFKEVAADAGARLWPESLFVFGNVGALVSLELVIFILLVVVSAAYLGGPGFVRLFQARVFPAVDWLSWHVSWKRKRLQRTFSAMLAVLLDGGVPEAEAVLLAGNCTANEICVRRVTRVADRLRRGEKLTDALGAFDESGEFHWRFSNALHSRGGFLAALRGWHQSLDAKAFQQEESTAHGVTTGIVIFNGFLVGLIATAMFGILVAILKVWL